MAFVLLLTADVFLNIRFVRSFFKLEPVVDQRRTGYVVSIFLLIGCLFWLIDSFFYAVAFTASLSFIDLFARKIPPANFFTRMVFLICCMGAGMVTSRILRRQKRDEMALTKARQDAETRETFFRTLVRAIPDLVWQPGINLWPVKVDLSQMDQILANLCVNARDSIEDIGMVIIGTENVTLDDGNCREHNGIKPGEYVKITVRDTGCGMSREMQAHIFEPFYTTKAPGKGTGLGLATVYGIMKQNDGFIYVFSEPGKGSVFRLYFPRYTGKILKKTGQVASNDIPIGKETIILVEDEPAIIKVTQKRLEQLGYTVLAFTSPIKAIESTRASSQIHLLMTDVVMPEMNGRDLARKIEEIHPGIKCLFISGYTANVIAHHGVLEDGLNFLGKPFSVKDLSIKLRKILEI